MWCKVPPIMVIPDADYYLYFETGANVVYYLRPAYQEGWSWPGAVLVSSEDDRLLAVWPGGWGIVPEWQVKDADEDVVELAGRKLLALRSKWKRISGAWVMRGLCMFAEGEYSMHPAVLPDKEGVGLVLLKDGERLAAWWRDGEVYVSWIEGDWLANDPFADDILQAAEKFLASLLRCQDGKCGQ